MNKHKKTLLTLLDLVYAGIDLENKIRNYGTDVQLSSTEIFLIKIVQENPGCHITGAAEKTGVSKAAVSQMVQRLEHKGIMQKRVSPDNRSKYLLLLTPKGEIAHREHMRIEKDGQERILKIIQQYSTNNLDVIIDFLNKTTESIKGIAK